MLDSAHTSISTIILRLLGVGRSLHKYIKAKSPTIPTSLVLFHFLGCACCIVCDAKLLSCFPRAKWSCILVTQHLQGLLNTLTKERIRNKCTRYWGVEKTRWFPFWLQQMPVGNEDRVLIIRMPYIPIHTTSPQRFQQAFSVLLLIKPGYCQ